MIEIPIRISSLGELALHEADAIRFLDRYAMTHTHEETVEKAIWLRDRIAARVRVEFGVAVSRN